MQIKKKTLFLTASLRTQHHPVAWLQQSKTATFYAVARKQVPNKSNKSLRPFDILKLDSPALH
jgi:hypothetical protein